MKISSKRRRTKVEIAEAKLNEDQREANIQRQMDELEQLKRQQQDFQQLQQQLEEQRQATQANQIAHDLVQHLIQTGVVHVDDNGDVHQG